MASSCHLCNIRNAGNGSIASTCLVYHHHNKVQGSHGKHKYRLVFEPVPFSKNYKQTMRSYIDLSPLQCIISIIHLSLSLAPCEVISDSHNGTVIYSGLTTTAKPIINNPPYIHLLCTRTRADTCPGPSFVSNSGCEGG